MTVQVTIGQARMVRLVMERILQDGPYSCEVVDAYLRVAIENALNEAAQLERDTSFDDVPIQSGGPPSDLRCQ